MKILHTVEFYHPSVGGMQEVVKQLSERLVRLGHDVTVFTTQLPDRRDKVINGVPVEGFAVKGKLAVGIDGELERYKQFLLNGEFDIVTNFAAQQWATDGMITILDKIRGKKVFVPTGFSGFYLPEYKKYFESMKLWMKQYDMNVFLSEDYRDINFARGCGVKRITVIPNGAAEDEFLPDAKINIRALLGIPEDHFLILHVGSHTGVKGHAEAIRIFSKARIRKATFLIVANSFWRGCTNTCKLKELVYNGWFKLKSGEKRLIITTLFRLETIAAYKAADMFLFSSNIECSPLVLFECMASKTPFLTTDVGNSAEIVEWSNAGMLLPTAKDAKGFSMADVRGSAKMVEDMYNDGILREKMRESGFRVWQERFTWDKITRTYEALYHKLLFEEKC